MAAPSTDLLILMSARAHGHPDAGATLRAVTAGAARDVVESARSGRPRRIWLAVSGAGRAEGPYLTWLIVVAREYGIELLAPDGPIVLVPGGSLYAGVATGASGWRVIRADGVRPAITDRYPIPEWDLMVPYREVTIGGLIAQPLPSGVILRETWSAPSKPDDDDFMIPVDPRHPTLVLAHRGVPRTTPAEVAALFTRLPKQASLRLTVSSTAGEGPDPSWLRSLGALIPHEVSAARSGAVTVPMVLSVGWHRQTARVYRLAGDPSVVAEVMPAGILLRPGNLYTSDGVAMFDPTSATLTLGSDGVEVSLDLVDALHHVFTASPREHGNSIRLRVAGVLGRQLRSRVTGLAADAGMSLDEPLAPAAPQVAAPPVPPRQLQAPPVRPDPIPPPEPRLMAAPPSLPSPSVPGPPSPTTSQPPPPPPPLVPTRTPPPPPPPLPPLMPALSPTPAPVPPPLPPTRPSSPAPSATPTPTPMPAQPRLPTPPPPTPSPFAGPVMTTSGPASDVGPASVPVGVVDASSAPSQLRVVADEADPPALLAVGRPGIVPLIVPDRSSTADEQRRFTAAMGAEFTDSLATVNAALSTWPALRADDSPGAKADFVAVCVYLGLSSGGAVALNAALRSGQPPPLDGYLPCLVSGLRRLPLHRRPVLCQCRHSSPIERLYTVGAVLIEPGFRSASVAIDVAVPDAEVDIVIWSRTARQLSVLASGRTIDEAVFAAGARFKVLDVKAPWRRPADGEVSEGGAQLPASAVLLREVLPDEEVSGTGLDSADEAVLKRLDKVLTQRRRTPVHTIDDDDLIERLTGPPPGLATAPATTQASS